jgi:hypothetical protein
MPYKLKGNKKNSTTSTQQKQSQASDNAAIGTLVVDFLKTHTFIEKGHKHGMSVKNVLDMLSEHSYTLDYRSLKDILVEQLPLDVFVKTVKEQ